ncbi:MAG: RDD family protein [Candidatus Bathyarchaeota archaeon]
MTFCKSCGKELPDNAKFCPNCGTAINNSVSSSETASERIFHESSLQEHWVKRIIAIIVDSLLVGIATTILGYLINVGGIFNLLNFPFAMGLIYVLYFTTTELIYGYTLGKKIVNLKVESIDDKKLNFERTLIRNISKIHFIFLILDTFAGFFYSKRPSPKIY